MSSLFLYDTRKKQKTAFIPLHDNEVSFYSCGPTVYNRVHIGNLRAFLFADTLQRYLRYGKNFSVKWVMNLTDVDDKTIRDSQQKFPDLSPMQALQNFTEIYTEHFFTDLEKLSIQKSDFFSTPKATDYIEEMKILVQKIVDNGFGYVSEGSVYFDVKKHAKDHTYGQLAHIDFDEMQSTSRVKSDEYEKSNASDFVLWKAKKEGEPSWDFELNGEDVSGRPGWHLECSAMEEKILGLPFDLHSGGVDLCFPHHEDEIAQSVAGYGLDPNTYWVHNEHLMVDGKKMSKSLGNFYTLEDLEKKGFSADDVRFFLVSNHYRTKVNLSDESLSASQKLLKRIRNFLTLAQQSEVQLEKTVLGNFQDAFLSAMDDDLNVSVALAAFFDFVRTYSSSTLSVDTSNKNVETVDQKKIILVIRQAEGVFGVRFLPEENSGSSGQEKASRIPEEILDLYEQRKVFRAEKNWSESDRLRDEISALGYEVRDGTHEGVSKL